MTSGPNQSFFADEVVSPASLGRGLRRAVGGGGRWVAPECESDGMRVSTSASEIFGTQLENNGFLLSSVEPQVKAVLQALCQASTMKRMMSLEFESNKPNLWRSVVTKTVFLCSVGGLNTQVGAAFELN